MKKPSWRTITLLAAMSLACITPMATASAATEPSSLSIQSEDELGLLVTVDEMAQMGATTEQVEAQASLFKTLSKEEAAQQKKKQQEQKEALKQLKALPKIPTEAKPEPEPGTVVPMIDNVPCWPNNDYYSVYWSNAFGYAVDCFANSGTYYPNYIVDVYALRPGNNVGRMYYQSGQYFYWSPWRGKSMDTYSFNGTIDPLAIQIA